MLAMFALDEYKQKHPGVYRGVYSMNLALCLHRKSGGPPFRRSCMTDRYFRLASACHVSMIVSGFSEIDTMPSSVSHCAKSG
ncbi:hypothetical protein BamMEX5DRAFT_2611 [Burkholderia ambifaria MEX-5]|uniref:Uncharacterized protein n=1 Tax=Burkholderia ambifaria MEX-5 TaxID=396597 RepID=B1T495_9BURK|nr:hypothetical protein BamMEX5DRAFT_2611 [Burkholderia ambifaria MEX-5]